MRPVRDVSERFWEKVTRGEGCWTWTAGRQGNGYGLFQTSRGGIRKSVGAHRAAWTLTNGPIPDGLWVLHKCDNRVCVRPDHLFLGDRRDNTLDAASKGRISTIGKSNMTHCNKGHAFTPDNTYVYKSGHRRCRECARTLQIRARAAIRASQ